MKNNIWKDFAELNNMTEAEFFNEVTLSTMAAMSMKLDKSDSEALKITRGQYTLILIDNEKVKENKQHE